MTAVMRRADDRRSASVMIKSSIRWSLAGNDVDWMMKASEPRTFSRTSTKISLSAKRRTLALARGRCSHSAMDCASAGLELPATSLMEPVLADIDASPRALLDTTFSLSRDPQNQVGGGGAGVASGLAGGFLAGQPQRALLVIVINVPDPGDHGFAANDLRRKIAAYAVRCPAFARHDREIPQLRLAVEHADHAVEHRRRRAVDRFEGDGGAATAGGHRKGVVDRPAAGAAAERAGEHQHRRGNSRARRHPDRPEQGWESVRHRSLRYR